MPLDYILDQKLNDPYAWFTLSTNRQVLDLNEDGTIDLFDYALLIVDVGRTGIYGSDIACMKKTEYVIGLPDGQVDETDLIAFVKEYNEMYPENPLPNPYSVLKEDFEGEINKSIISYGDAIWTISNDSHQGNYSVKSGKIKDNQSSILEVTIDALEGNISFWRKVSCEKEFYDKLVFYIDDIETEAWSGELDWEQVSYQVDPGNHTLKWEYTKDESSFAGEDAAWIDDIIID
jgi:hypothetical protein